ncbi:MAG: hypothetical protein IH851_11260 [Armatimonadetes bacterium]|nr:hypothetical protein [Armatimonadota bacterium]
MERSGARFESPSDGDLIFATDFMFSRPTSDRLVAFMQSVSSDTLKEFAITKMSERPSPAGVQALVEVLDSPEIELRYRVLSKFARWGDRPDLEPRWVRVPGSRSRIENEDAIIRHWRENPP